MMLIPTPARVFRSMAIVLGAAFCGLCFPAEVPRSACGELLSLLHPDEPTARFIRLLHALSVEKNLLQVAHLEALINSDKPINPLIGEQADTQNFVYGTSFDDILKEGGIKWETVRETSKALAEQKTSGSKRTHEAHEKAKPIFYPFLLRIIGTPNFEVPRAWSDKDGNIYLAYFDNGVWTILNPANDSLVTYKGRPDSRFSMTANGEIVSFEKTGNSIALSQVRTGERVDIPYDGFLILTELVSKPDGNVAALAGDHLVDFQAKTISPVPTHGMTETHLVVSDAGRPITVGRKNDSVNLVDAFTGRLLVELDPKLGRAGDVHQIWESSKGELFVMVGATVVLPGGEKTIGARPKVIFLQDRSGKVFFLAGFDDGLELREVDSGASKRVSMPGDMFHIDKLVELPDGRKIGIRSRIYLNELWIADFSTGEETGFSIPAGGVLMGVSHKAGGTLIGVFNENRSIHFIQLYGPPPP